jgi:peptidyl-prolyl cis-trans isomerase D
MITWIQVNVQKHNRLLFSILLGVIIVTFVLTIGNQNFFGSKAETFKRKDFLGYNLANPNDMQAIMLKGQLSMYLNPDLGYNQNNTQDYALSRIGAIALANEFGIPQPVDADIKEYISGLSVFQENDAFSPKRYKEFIDAVSNSGRFSDKLIAQTLSEDFRIARILNVMGGPGFVAPYETQNEYIQRNTRWTLAVATFDYSSFNPKQTPTEEALKAFYDGNPNRFEIASQVNVDLIQFNQDAFIDSVPTPDESELEAYFEQNRYLYAAQQKKPESESENTPIAYEQVNDKVLSNWKQEQAKQLASESADHFTVSLWRNKIALDSEDYKALLLEYKGSTQSLPAYTLETPPTVKGVPASFLKDAFTLVESDRYFSDLTETDSGAAVLIFRSLIEARTPEFSAAKDKVIRALNEETRKKLFVEQGKTIYDELNTAIFAGNDFKAAAEGLGLKVESHPAFTGRDMPWNIRMELADLFRNRAQGELTPMTVRDTRGLFVYIQQKEMPSVEANTSEVKEMTTEMARQIRVRSAWTAIENWILSRVDWIKDENS